MRISRPSPRRTRRRVSAAGSETCSQATSSSRSAVTTLGTGKTTFVRGAARALGVQGPVTSPTYTIGHRYDGVSHLDLYRFERFTEEDWAALEPYFEDAVVFVEWPEAAAGRLPPVRVSV